MVVVTRAAMLPRAIGGTMVYVFGGSNWSTVHLLPRLTSYPICPDRS